MTENLTDLLPQMWWAEIELTILLTCLLANQLAGCPTDKLHETQ